MGRKRTIRAALIGALIGAFFAASAVPLPADAAKPGQTFNNVVIDIHGGNAAAFASCLNTALDSAKHGKKVKNNDCKGFAKAKGGVVEIKDVSLFVDQEGVGQSTHNNVKISFQGGDATAVASCVNYLDGTDEATVRNSCATAAEADGGDVVLTGVDIVIFQL
jgi:hypothetical protein